jgi:hypothetical protein
MVLFYFILFVARVIYDDFCQNAAQHIIYIQGTFSHSWGTFTELSVNFREHSGNIQGTFREHSVNFVKTPRNISFLFRGREGNLREGMFEGTVSIQRTFEGIIFRERWEIVQQEDSGDVRRTLRGTFRKFREHSGNIQGTFRGHSGNIQGTFSKRSGNH